MWRNGFPDIKSPSKRARSLAPRSTLSPVGVFYYAAKFKMSLSIVLPPLLYYVHQIRQLRQQKVPCLLLLLRKG